MKTIDELIESFTCKSRLGDSTILVTRDDLDCALEYLIKYRKSINVDSNRSLSKITESSDKISLNSELAKEGLP